jgi:hypothetical protein
MNKIIKIDFEKKKWILYKSLDLRIGYGILLLKKK